MRKRFFELSILIVTLCLQACNDKNYSLNPNFSKPKEPSNCVEISENEALSFFINETKEKTNWASQLIYDYYCQIPKELANYYAEHPMNSVFSKYGLLAYSRTIINKDNGWVRTGGKIQTYEKSNREITFDIIILYSKEVESDNLYKTKWYSETVKRRYVPFLAKGLFTNPNIKEDLSCVTWEYDSIFSRPYECVLFPGLNGVFAAETGLCTAEAIKLLSTPQDKDEFLVQRNIIKNDIGDCLFTYKASGEDSLNHNYINNVTIQFENNLPSYYESSILINEYQCPTIIKKKWYIQDTTPNYWPNDYYYTLVEPPHNNTHI